jgi:hypothetical protein
MAMTYIKSRIYPRKMVTLMAEYLSGRRNRPVFIGDVSETGIHMTIVNRGKECPFFPGNNVELRFRLSSGESVCLHCRVRWISRRRPPDGATDNIGLEIITAPSHYRAFVRALF